MLKGIFTFRFDLNQQENGDIEPKFIPLQIVFAEEVSDMTNYLELIEEIDLFGIFYQHTAGYREINIRYSNFFKGNLKKTPYQVISFFKQVNFAMQFLTISVFELDDEVEIYEDLIKDLGEKLETSLEELTRAINSNKITLIDQESQKLLDNLKFTIFQIDRLSNLDKMQKVGLIFKSKERMEILRALREQPQSKRQLKTHLEKVNRDANIDILLDPFLELNLIRRDWISGERDEDTKLVVNQGEYLFLIKDFSLALIPNEDIMRRLSEDQPLLYIKYKKIIDKFFKEYNPNTQTDEDLTKLASILLKPDVYDFFALMRYNIYPLDKIPKIFSKWADTESILEELKELNIITIIIDKKDRKWAVMKADIKPLFFFPEHLFPNIRKAYKSKLISFEVAKKAFDLLEVTFIEKVELP